MVILCYEVCWRNNQKPTYKKGQHDKKNTEKTRISKN